MERTEGMAAPAPLEGWTRRFTAAYGRLAEMVEFYRTLGFEVRLEPVDSSEEATRPDACAQCVVITLARTIYTRRPGETEDVDGQRQ